jgi:hypothetical protein
LIEERYPPISNGRIVARIVAQKPFESLGRPLQVFDFMARPERETSNSSADAMLEILAEWNQYLKAQAPFYHEAV